MYGKYFGNENMSMGCHVWKCFGKRKYEHGLPCIFVCGDIWICYVIMKNRVFGHWPGFWGDFRWIGLHVGSSSWVCLRGCIGLRIPLGNPMELDGRILELCGSWVSCPVWCEYLCYKYLMKCEYLHYIAYTLLSEPSGGMVLQDIHGLRDFYLTPVLWGRHFRYPALWSAWYEAIEWHDAEASAFSYTWI